MATTPRSKPYTLDYPLEGDAGVLPSVRTWLQNTDTMFQELYDDLLAVAGDISSSGSGSGLTGVTNDTNVTGSISGTTLILGWTGTLAAARLNSNVVQAVVNDANITGSITAQVLTFAWSGTLSQARGGFGQSSASRTNGQVPIGRTSDGAWVFSTLSAGAGISVTNGAGSISIASTVAAGVAANVALSRVYLRA